MRPPRSVRPALNPLEARLTPSSSRPESGGLLMFLKEEDPPPPPPLPPPPPPPDYPRTGGIFVQTGTYLYIGVGQPSSNTVQIETNGAGGYQAQWNGGPVHSFTDVPAIEVITARGKSNHVTFSLPDAPPATPAVQVVNHASATGGTAVESGTNLTVTVSRPTTNTVQILDQGEGAIQVQNNGGTVQSFTSVTTIVVDARNAKTNHITFYTPPLT